MYYEHVSFKIYSLILNFRQNVRTITTTTSQRKHAFILQNVPLVHMALTVEKPVA